MILLLKKQTKTCCLQYQLLLAEIEKIRELMMFIALEKGFTDSKTIEIIQKLDQLLNRTN
ncbi:MULTISPECIES: aspartyl-phosphate phosphatase Spo0E family protein [unclassified Bacillus (in: firmicutes)]|uniref:aspartyl-phosphate phosphatase Spo0E family protein n=1 Tax=unclassified Bacillus (in: firmicutes) TaxID=185979 RepID=UPI003D1DA5C7